eukprot:CAMPEP_0174298378 /NCGR_PEP_ID=MMETSP0809-20121228/53560_1 /TAXON_ID=73025 ORGANISM="Eutreptiella gymnastica-like, Strain CCMP1594" /NCGR_SAMPLE_ID=MMETSP0809 /ASSEMBLY_ACC=CAM_ASM_000658 /LENGTH=312 /DNA_ID=CAMNT_0015402787 /DNA_START=46 /DNA_END=984 /DNA_ORIENTATION=+
MSLQDVSDDGSGVSAPHSTKHPILPFRHGQSRPQTWRHAYSWVFEHLLHGKVFHVDGPPPAPDEDLPKRIQSMGGILQDTLDASCTHVVTHSRGKCCQEAMALRLTVVTSQWINDCETYCRIMNADKNVLYKPIPRIRAMSNCLVAQSGFENPFRKKIKYFITEIGAKYTQSLSRINTHVLVPDMQHTSVKIAGAKKWGIKIVHWWWLHDCLQHRTVLPEADYEKGESMPDAQAYFLPPKDLKEFCRLYILQHRDQIDYADQNKYGLPEDVLSYLGQKHALNKLSSVEDSTKGEIGSDSQPPAAFKDESPAP